MENYIGHYNGWRYTKEFKPPTRLEKRLIAFCYYWYAKSWTRKEVGATWAFIKVKDIIPHEDMMMLYFCQSIDIEILRQNQYFCKKLKNKCREYDIL